MVIRQALTLSPPLLEEYWSTVPTWVTFTLGTSIVLLGVGSKMAAVFWTGYNTYYWYDMVTGIPNAYFVEGGIYKYVSSPTYTLGE